VRIAPVFAILIPWTAAVFGQSAPARLSFEVASVKPSPPPGEPGLHFGTRIDEAQADFGNITLRGLIMFAYRLRGFQLSAPDWVNTARFDVLGKLPDGAKPDQVPEMVQTLLADRFHLVLHPEDKEFPVYALVVGKDGPKLTAKPDNYNTAARTGTRPQTMDAYASILSGYTDHPVLDKTELQGEYLVSTADLSAERGQQIAAQAQAHDAVTTIDPLVPAVARSVLQYGLRIEPRKVALPFFVVDHIDKAPSEN